MLAGFWGFGDDRTLLGTGRDALNRPLTTGERHLLRKLARDLVTGEGADAEMASQTDSSTD